LQFSAYGPPAVLTIKEIPKPEPGKGEVLIQIKATAINPSDVKVLSQWFTSPSCGHHEIHSAEIADLMNDLRAGFQEGYLQAPAIRTWPLERSVEAYELAEKGGAPSNTYCFLPQQNSTLPHTFGTMQL